MGVARRTTLGSTRTRRKNGQQTAIAYHERLEKSDLLEIYRRLWFARIFDEALYDAKKKVACGAGMCTVRAGRKQFKWARPTRCAPTTSSRPSTVICPCSCSAG